MANDNDDTSKTPDIDVNEAGRGQEPLEGMPGVSVVRSIGQDEWDTYSNKSDHGSGN